MPQFHQMITSVNWHTPSWDLFILAAWAAVSVVYTFAAGRGRVVNILISLYVAKLLVLEMPFLTDIIDKKFNLPLASLQHLAAFVAVFLVLFMLLGRYVFRTSSDSHEFSAMFFSLIFSVLQIGLLINIILSFLPSGVQANFSQLIQTMFIKNPASFVWLVIPLVYLVVLGKFLSEDDEV